jgi:NodT family efflux transporter outer membrane factor (OMF) lipoprotein
MKGTGPKVFASLLVSSFFLVGCTMGPDFVRPQAPEVTRYTPGEEPTRTVKADGKTQHFKRGEEIVSEWWRLFRSEELDAVIRTAVRENQNLKSAQARLRQSRETLWATYGALSPQFNGSFQATREKFSPAAFGGNFSSSLFTLYQATATVSYNLDFFGRTRRTIEAQQAQVDYQEYEMEATYLTLVGQVVNAVIAQAGLRAQISATEEIVEFERQQVRIVETQAKAGIIGYAAVFSIQSQLAATEATLPPLRQSVSQNSHLLATLLGQMPAEWTPPPVDLTDLTLPSDLPVSLPSFLVRQRPDILAAEAQLHAASANIGVATASLLPNFTINADYGQNSDALHTLFDSGGNFWSLGAGLTAPLFHGGTLWFQRKAAIAAFDAALADYRQTVLSALAQVADVLRAAENDAQTLEAQSRSLESAEGTLKLVRTNYEAGAADYIQVLVANQQYQQAKIGYLLAKAKRLQDTAALFLALGGGWWNDYPLASTDS